MAFLFVPGGLVRGSSTTPCLLSPSRRTVRGNARRVVVGTREPAGTGDQLRSLCSTRVQGRGVRAGGGSYRGRNRRGPGCNTPIHWEPGAPCCRGRRTD